MMARLNRDSRLRASLAALLSFVVLSLVLLGCISSALQAKQPVAKTEATCELEVRITELEQEVAEQRQIIAGLQAHGNE